MIAARELTAIDVFAGAGGLSEGFARAGYKPVAHVEMDEAACNTLRTRAAYHWLARNNKLSAYNQYLRREITRSDFYSKIPADVLDTVIHSEIGPYTVRRIFRRLDTLLNGRPLDILLGGPPCQAYSIVGRSRDSNRMLGDKRNYLFKYYAKFLKRYQPKYFVFENVTGLLSARDENGVLYFDEMKDEFRKQGYAVEHRTLLASDYGVPQNRKRVILVGQREQQSFTYPTPKRSVPTGTINQLFSDLPKLMAGESSNEKQRLSPAINRKQLLDAGILRKGNSTPLTLHFARYHNLRDLEIYKRTVKAWNASEVRPSYNELPERLKTHSNRTSFTDRFKVVAGNKRAAHTVVAHIAKDGHYYIHPDVDQNRSLTPREAARLQTFPDDYFFESIKDEVKLGAPMRQIGNAVPVLLAEKLANQLRLQWHD